MQQSKALIAMSGGVDSSVAAFLTAQDGYSCIGGTMLLYDCGDVCGSSAAVGDARAVAQRLGMPFHIFDLTGMFRECVIDDFVSSYENGLTPNPCIRCNRHLKFSAFLEKAKELGCECMVTGHYARIRKDETSGRLLLCKAADPAKDQSYFLYAITQEQLRHIRFPLGELTKEQVRSIALEQGFINAKKRDSQDICFVPDGDYFAFLQKLTGKEYAPGSFLDTSGNIVGTHHGAVGYTLGQRKGLGLAMGQPNRQLPPPNSDLQHIQDHFGFSFPTFALTRFSRGFHSLFWSHTPVPEDFLTLLVISCPGSNIGQAVFPHSERKPSPTPRCRDCTIAFRNCKSFLRKRQF